MLVSLMSTPFDQTKLDQGNICPPEGARISPDLAAGRDAAWLQHQRWVWGLRNHDNVRRYSKHTAHIGPARATPLVDILNGIWLNITKPDILNDKTNNAGITHMSTPFDQTKLDQGNIAPRRGP